VLEKQAAADRHLGQAADRVARRDKVGRREVVAAITDKSWLHAQPPKFNETLKAT
jgi:hypothetical protein